MNFRDGLISAYRENPCQLLPNALWKTFARLDHLQTSICIEKDVVTNLQAWNETSILVYWTRHREQSFALRQPQTDLNLALIHQDYLHSFPSTRFAVQKPYFRLRYMHNGDRERASLPGTFSFTEVDIQQQAGNVSRLIGQCYQDLRPSVESVMAWAKHPTFDPALWVWVMDNSKGIPIALGIGEIDALVQEGSLEWIQVLPAYRGMGIGKCIVQELLSRLEKRVNFSTVAGEVDNPTNPEALYRSCGFYGSDVWWMFSTR